jgi:WD40 repeat protein
MTKKLAPLHTISGHARRALPRWWLLALGLVIAGCRSAPSQLSTASLAAPTAPAASATPIPTSYHFVAPPPATPSWSAETARLLVATQLVLRSWQNVLPASNAEANLAKTLRAIPYLAIVDDGSYQTTTAQFAVDGQSILMAGQEGLIRQWPAGEPGAVLADNTAWVIRISPSPAGDRFATGGNDGKVRLWDYQGNLLTVMVAYGYVDSLDFSPDGRRLLGESGDHVRLWDRDGNVVRVLERHAYGINAAALSADGQHILAASTYVQLSDGEGNPLRTLHPHGGTVWFAQFSPDGRRILTDSGNYSNLIELWDLDGNLLDSVPTYYETIVTALFVAGGEKVLTLSMDGVVGLWDGSAGTMRVLEHGEGPDGFVTQAVASPTGGFATATMAGNIRVWSERGEVVRLLPGAQQPVNLLVFSSSGDRLISVG